MNESTLARVQRTIALASHERSETLDLHGLGLKTLPPLTDGLRGLRRLDLSGNRLRTMPNELWQLVHLEELDLSGNRLEVLDAGIGSLHALRSLDLSENRLNDLPPELAACTRLVRLSLFGNLFSTLPEAVLALSGLRWLDLAGNRLEMLPDLRRLNNLEVLDLAGNRLSVPPVGLSGLKELRTLDLSQNRLTSVEDLALPAQIEELFLDDNQLKQIPGPLTATGRMSARGNPIAQPESAENQIATGVRSGPLRQLVTGGYEAGKRYFEAPDYHFRFVLNLPSKPAVDGSLNLYFKAFTGIPVSMRLNDGLRVDLTRVGRKAAREIAASSDSAMLEFPYTQAAATVEAVCEFAERTLERVPDSMVLEMTGTQVGRAGPIVESPAKSEPLEATPMAPADEAGTSQAAGAAPLPAPVPGGTCRGSVPVRALCCGC